MASVFAIVRYILRFGMFFVTNIYGLFAYVMWAFMLLPLRILWPSLFWKLESIIFRGLQSLLIVWMGTGDYGVIEAGDDIRKLSEDEVLLLCNHQSTADTPLVMMALWQKGQCMGNSMWIMDWIFRFTNFGIISSIRMDFFIKQGKEERERQARVMAEHLRQCFLSQGRKWIILFPEGGFLRNRLETSQRYARKNNYPVLHNVTLPRIGALKVIIDTLAPDHETSVDSMANGNCDADPERPLKWVIDMTIGYCNSEGSPPDMFGMCVGYREKQDMYVHYRAYPMSLVPRDSEGLQKWMYDRYVEKEQLLDHFKTHGKFPADSEGRLLPTLPPKRISYDWVSVALFQGFYLASAYFHYTCILQPLLALLF